MLLSNSLCATRVHARYADMFAQLQEERLGRRIHVILIREGSSHDVVTYLSSSDVTIIVLL